MKNRVRIIIKIIVICCMLTLIIPYIKAEYLTIKYGDEFLGLEQQTRMLNSVKYYKVVSYTSSRAQVFYVTHNSGNAVTFQKTEQEEWDLLSWNVIWSKTGSADGFMWPYYR